MAPKYDFSAIEKKWQKRWEEESISRAEDFSKKPKFYCLVEFPYPSGEGLHVGHPRSYTALDVLARKRRMEGWNVLYPMGFDAFGLPTENYAIKTGVHPAVVTERNIETFTAQLKSLGFSFDWDRRVVTTDPAYYRWTQWIFLKMYEHGLAYKAKMPINWCPSCKIGLANEEVVGGACERCGATVEQREKEQWLLRITRYADRLIDDLATVDYPDRIKTQQINWIGRSEGAMIDFEIKSGVALSYVLLHGYTGSPSKNFFPWLKKELEKRGAKVYAPELPNADNPRVAEQVAKVLKETTFDENTVLIGHSLGGVVAMKVLEELKKPIKKTIFVTSFTENRFITELFEPHTFDWKFNAKKIRTNAGAIEILRDTTDDTVPQYQADNIKILFGGSVFDFAASEPHACGENEPEILRHCIDSIQVFTTRPDTLFGATYMVLAPEHELLTKGKLQIANRGEVDAYIAAARGKTDEERTAETKSKTGVELKGIRAINPTNKEEIPIFVADYVLAGYGTGAIMAVPAHDERDFEFAKKFNLNIRTVINPPPIEGNYRKDYERLILDLEDISNKNKKHFFLSGGWALAIALNEVYRDFEDIDVCVDFNEVLWWKNVLTNLGFRLLENKEKDSRYFVSFRKDGVKVDIFGIGTDESEQLYDMEKGRRDYWDISSSEIKTFVFQDKKIQCLSPRAVVKLKFRSEEKDKIDVFKAGFGPWIGDGFLINSGKFDGMKSEEAKLAITEEVGGERRAQYHLRDWIFSRQRYWGEPIPMVHCEACALRDPSGQGWVPVPEGELPVLLPNAARYEPTDTGESPLAAVTEWVNTKCPKCGGPAKRETDTMPNWAGSNWYFLRYTDPRNGRALADPKKLSYWTPVDWYNGGMEHTTLHLLYSRFVYKFLYDIGAVPRGCGPEPYRKRTAHGMVLGEGGEKMSKSRGNVVNPDEMVERFGADAFRVYEMFMGPFDQDIAWSTNGLVGAYRFLERAWKLFSDANIQMSRSARSSVGRHANDTNNADERLKHLLHKTIKKITEDVEAFKFNTAISALMILLRGMEGSAVGKEARETFLKLLAPFAPHLTEELWSALGNEDSIHRAPWPRHDPALARKNRITLAVQVNGKFRGTVNIPAGASQREVEALVKGDVKLQEALKGRTIEKTIFVPDRLVNFVIYPVRS